MSYLVLARKYRPATFADVIGQEHITDLLKKSITASRVHHAYLFCGPRGIGKTSCARILAKSLNCQNGPTLTPCGECPSCKEISQGSSFDVLEIDGASNRGIDEIRALRENVKFAPSYGTYKIYIVDEVHMLTMEAFNALLKTLEEPPPHVKFIFATTEPHKLPATIISRCQRYDFKRISLKTLVDTLIGICKKENFTVTEDALYAIAKAAQGSFRDALSILDQISALSDRTISDGDVYSMLGLVETELLFDLTDALAAGDCARALDIFDAIIEKGKDVKQLSRDLVEHFRDLMIIKVGGKTLERLVDYPAAVKERYWNQAQNFTIPGILKALDALIEAQDIARVTETLRTPLEIAFAKLTYRPDGVDACDFSAPTPAPKAAAPAAVAVLKTPPLPTAQKFSPPEILKDRRGEINLSASTAVETAEEEKNEPSAAGLLDLEKIRHSWDALTYAVSREKMSLATYLQEGRPVALKGERLTVGFTADLHFYKETLERNEYILLVEKVFSEKLKAKILIEYKIVGENAPAAIAAENHEPLVQTALETFKGKIVSTWHNE